MTTKQGQNPGQPIGGSDHQVALSHLSASLDSLSQECLDRMKDRFSTGEDLVFYRAFVCAFSESYHKRKLNKARFWSLKALLASALGASGAGSLVLGGIFTLLNALASRQETGGSIPEFLQLIAVIKSHWLFCFVVIAAFIAMWFSLVCFKYELSRRNYRETWARNSVTYHRLFFAMIQFQSARIGKEAFMDRVFEILENNIERFEYNVTGTGKNHPSAVRKNSEPSSG